MAVNERAIPAVTRSWGRIALAFAIAVISDAVNFIPGLTLALPVQIPLDLATAVAIWFVLGRPALLAIPLILEAIPMVDVIPWWTGVVAIIAVTGGLPAKPGFAPRKSPDPTPTPPTPASPPQQLP